MRVQPDIEPRANNESQRVIFMTLSFKSGPPVVAFIAEGLERYGEQYDGGSPEGAGAASGASQALFAEWPGAPPPGVQLDVCTINDVLLIGDPARRVPYFVSMHNRRWELQPYHRARCGERAHRSPHRMHRSSDNSPVCH